MKTLILAALCVAMVLNPFLINIALASGNAAEQEEVIIPARPGQQVAQQREAAAQPTMTLRQVHQRLLTDIEVTQQRIAQLEQSGRNRRALNRLAEYRALKLREFKVLQTIDRIEQQMEQGRQQRHLAAQSEIPRRRASSNRSGDRVDIDNRTNLSVILETDDVARAIRESAAELKTEWYESWWFWTIVGVAVFSSVAFPTMDHYGVFDTNYK
jgi:hypothetical protein